MTTTPEPGERLAWDSAHFGLEIGRVGTDAPDEAATWMRAEAIDVAYRLTPITRLAEVDGFVRAGFRLVDLRVELDLALGARPVPDVAPAPVRVGTPADLDALGPVAAAAYGDSRFYQDGRFEPARCDALYRVWLERSLTGERAERVFVAGPPGAAVGFVTCALDADVGSIGLVGVAAEARGQGLAGAMLAEALGWLEERGASRVRVVTQGRNVAAQRLYQAFAFRTRELQCWLHGWRDELT